MIGGMAEWLKAAVLKTVSGVTRSGVRIPLPPPCDFCPTLRHGAYYRAKLSLFPKFPPRGPLSMARCVYCQGSTELYVKSVPVCLKCDSERERKRNAVPDRLKRFTRA